MSSLGSFLDGQFLYCLLLTTVTVVTLQALGASSIVAPTSNCYALDNSSHIFDFSNWLGHPFEYEGKDSDLVVRFCKDVESRLQTGYVDFGRFNKFNYFVAGSGHIDFVQEFCNGDLLNCERTHDKMGRTAQVNILCGSCSNGQCTGDLGCICNVTYESTCRVLVELAIPCKEQGVRVFEGFTVGFHPRSWEIVYNGMTQLGFDKSHQAFSFGTEQTHVALYMTAIASLSTLVQEPTVKIFPEHGLKVGLSGSGATGRPPTTLSPSMLVVDWRCEKAHNTPYEVNITIPVEGYEPIQFTLSKMCEYPQGKGGGTTRGWAIFGVVSCMTATTSVFIVHWHEYGSIYTTFSLCCSLSLEKALFFPGLKEVPLIQNTGQLHHFHPFFVLSTVFCCGGFIYKTRVERQHGLDALPGMTILSACLEAVSGGTHSYSRAEDTNSAFINQASWERQPDVIQGTRQTSERKYGSI